MKVKEILEIKLKKEMKRIKITQTELAKRIGVSQQQISRWCRGKSLPGVEEMPRLCSIFDVSYDYFIKEEIINENKPDNNKPEHLPANTEPRN